MTAEQIAFVAIASLLCYWSVGAVIYLILNRTSLDEDSFAVWWAFGLLGLGLLAVFFPIAALIRAFKRAKSRRVFKENCKRYRAIVHRLKDDTDYWCTLNELLDFEFYSVVGRRLYEIKDRSVPLDEIGDTLRVTDEMLKEVSVNCNHCIHQKECDKLTYGAICTVDAYYDIVLEFDKFERK